MANSRVGSALALLGVVLIASSATAQASGPKPLILTEAVALAQKFVVLNGYTDSPPTAERSRITYESLEWNRKTLLKRRHDTLQRYAYAYRRVRRNRKPGWTIVFRYQPTYTSDTKHGRAVTMDIDGSHPRVEHEDATLRAFTKIKPPPHNAGLPLEP